MSSDNTLKFTAVQDIAKGPSWSWSYS